MYETLLETFRNAINLITLPAEKNVATAERAVALIVWQLPKDRKSSIDQSFRDQTPLIELTAFDSGVHAAGCQDIQDADFESEECFPQIRLRKRRRSSLMMLTAASSSMSNLCHSLRLITASR